MHVPDVIVMVKQTREKDKEVTWFRALSRCYPLISLFTMWSLTTRINVKVVASWRSIGWWYGCTHL